MKTSTTVGLGGGRVGGEDLLPLRGGVFDEGGSIQRTEGEGDDEDDDNDNHAIDDLMIREERVGRNEGEAVREAGLVVRAAVELLDKAKEAEQGAMGRAVRVRCTAMELYNNKVYDLLAEKRDKEVLGDKERRQGDRSEDIKRDSATGLSNVVLGSDLLQSRKGEGPST